MNKKLFAMMMVPVLVVMGGTFAFSAWTGSANAFFNQSAANVAYTETLTFEHTNAMYTNLSMTGGPGTSIGTVVLNTNTNTILVGTSSGTAGGDANVYGNVTNMVPGDYVYFQVAITNTGSATLNTSTFEWAGATVYNALGNALSTPQSISSLQPPVGDSYLQNVVQNGISNVGATQSHLWYLINATSTSATPGILHSGDTLTYSVYAILSASAPASAMGTSFAFEIIIPVTAAQ